MPKLLRKDICRSDFSLVFLVISIGVVYYLKNANVVLNFFTILNWYLLILNLSGVKKPSLPDYMYIAPYSYEQRKSLVKSYIVGRLFNSYVFCVIVFILPILVFSIINGMTFIIIMCLVEGVLIFSLIHSGLYVGFLSMIKGNSIPIEVTCFIMLGMFEGIEIFINDDADSKLSVFSTSEYLADKIALVLIVVISMVMTIVCHRKYYNLMISYCSDYELSRR